MADFLKIRGMTLPMTLPEDYNLGHRAQPVAPFNSNYGYHMPPVQIGAPPPSNQQSPPVYSGGNPQNPSGYSSKRTKVFVLVNDEDIL